MYSGSCHCGRVAFDIAVEGPIGDVVECNCSHCSRKGYLLWFQPREQVTFRSGEADLATYTFNKHHIQHRFCTHCGCAPLGFGTGPDGRATAAINVRCLEGVELDTLKRIPFDGRSY